MHPDLESKFAELFVSQLEKMLVKRADSKTINKDYLDRAIAIRYNDCIDLHRRQEADKMISDYRTIETNESFLQRITRNF